MDRFSDRLGPCDFCPAKNAKPEAVETRLAWQVVSICPACRKRGVLEKVKKQQDVEIVVEPVVPVKPKIERVKIEVGR